jgi:hypothetical protein
MKQGSDEEVRTGRPQTGSAELEACGGGWSEEWRLRGANFDEVRSNFQRALEQSIDEQPMATVALAAVLGFLLGVLWTPNATGGSSALGTFGVTDDFSHFSCAGLTAVSAR